MNPYKSMFKYKEVLKPEDVPTVDHYAILVFDSYSSDGGYPECGSQSYPFVHYYAYDNREDWQTDLEKYTLDKGYGRREARGIFVKAVKTKVVTTFEVDEK